MNQTTLVFPASVQKDPHLLREETALYHARRSNLQESITGLQHALRLVEAELAMTEPLVAKGAASEVEVLRLKRQATDLHNQIQDIRYQYEVNAREELA